MRGFIVLHPRPIIALSLLFVLLLGGTLYGGYRLKPDSASGRFLLWTVTSRAAIEQMPFGVGLGGFPAAYADAQADYFARGGSEKEQWVAGSPEYAFNEYAQIFLEQGIGGVLLLLGLIVGAIRSAHRNKQVGVAASLGSLAVVAFASYPFRLVPFQLLTVVLMVLSQQREPDPSVEESPVGCSAWWFVGAMWWLFIVAGAVCQTLQIDAYRRWSTAIVTRQSHSYGELSSRLHYEPRFLFDHAKCLIDTEQRYTEACRLLQRASSLSSDPMIYNVMGRCFQHLEQYDEAEASYRRAAAILPGRLYPHYLLLKLYQSEPYNQPSKASAEARLILALEPKVESRAVREMREEARQSLVNSP